MPSRSQPWEEWVPGVLSKNQIRQLINENYITAEASEKNLGASSIDLTLSQEVYLLPGGTIKPSGARYQRYISELATRLPPMNDEGMVFNPRETYLVKLRERLYHLNGSGIHGQATAKSSVGRIDVLVRLIVDGMNCYDSFSSLVPGIGDLYIEITPLTFPVRVRPGIALSQLRLFYGKPDDCRVRAEEAFKTSIKRVLQSETLDTLTVDLEPTTIRGHDVIAFRAKENGAEPFAPVPLWEEPDNPSHAPAPWHYWDFVKPSDSKRLTLKNNAFYILKSKESLALPKGLAVYCRATDESFGEMRIHYAGFAHPWFGRMRKDAPGTPLIFEVRGHDVNVSLQDGESMARLLFYRMSEDASEDDAEQAYEGQQLKLSKYFREWPSAVTVDESGSVDPAT